LKVYNILGKEVATPVNEVQNPGYYKIRFDPTSLASGVYFYRLETSSFSLARKLVLLR
jgi:hypothetical protein